MNRSWLGTALPVAGWLGLIVAAWAKGNALIDATGGIGLGAPPLFGYWDLQVEPALFLPCAVALGGVIALPRLAQALSWRSLCWTFAGAALLWSLALALTTGAGGVFDPLASPYEYLAAVPRVGDPGSFLSSFTERINDYPIHVQGHPPGFVLTLWGLDRVGLGGPKPASILVVLVAASAVPAALISARAVAGELVARAAAPFLVLAPAAIWIATSADAFYMGVGAWAVAATVLAVTSEGRRSKILALEGGAMFGASALLSYGLVLLGAVPLVVALARRRITPLFWAAAAAAVVVCLPLLAGFWWLDGLSTTRREYVVGVAGDRPYSYFVWANLAALGIALGPAAAVALTRVRSSAMWILPAGGLAAIAFADLSGMSKAEVERIWLPFIPWVLLATASLAPRRLAVALLAAQAGVAILVQATVGIPW